MFKINNNNDINDDNDDNDNNDNNDTNILNITYKRYINKLKDYIIIKKYKRHRLSLSIYHHYHYQLKYYYYKYYNNINNNKSRSLYISSLLSSSSISLLKLKRTLLLLLNNTLRKKLLLAKSYYYKHLLSVTFGSWLLLHKDNNIIINNSNIKSINYYNKKINNIIIKKFKIFVNTTTTTTNNNSISIIFYVFSKLKHYYYHWYHYYHNKYYKILIHNDNNNNNININSIKLLRYFKKLMIMMIRKKTMIIIIRKRISNNNYYYKNKLIFFTKLKNIINNNNITTTTTKNVDDYYYKKNLLKYLYKWYSNTNNKHRHHHNINNINNMYIEKTLIRCMLLLWGNVDSNRRNSITNKYETIIYDQLKLRRSIKKWYEWYYNKDNNDNNIIIHQKMFISSLLRRSLVSWIRYLKRRYIMIPIIESSNNHKITFWRHSRLSVAFTSWSKRLKSKRYQRLRAKRYYQYYTVKKLKIAINNFKKLCIINKRYKRCIVKSVHLYESRRLGQAFEKMSMGLVASHRNDDIILKGILFWKLWRENNYIQQWKALVAHRRLTRVSMLIPEITANTKKGAVDSIIKDGIASWQEKVLFIDKSERAFLRLKAVNNIKEKEDVKKEIIPVMTAPTVSNSNVSNFECTPSSSLVKVPPRTLPDALSLPLPLHGQKLSIPFNLNHTPDYNKLLYDTSITHSDSHRDNVFKLEKNQHEKRKQRLDLAKDIIKFVSEFKDIGLNLGLRTINQDLNPKMNNI